MGEHEGGLHLADRIDEPEPRLAVHLERIVAEIEELDVGHAERLRGFFRFLAPACLHFLKRHAGVLPELGALAALAIGEADDRDGVAPLGVKRDRAGAAPDEIGAVGAYDQGCLCGHSRSYSAASPTGGVPWVWKLSIVFRPQA